MNAGTKVRIVPESHPHFDETGVFTGEQKDIKHVGIMYAVKLDECEHGVNIAEPVHVLMSQIEEVR